MPEFILPAEADRCPHCGSVLRVPPSCCIAMEREHYVEATAALDELDALDDGYCPKCGGAGFTLDPGVPCDQCGGHGEAL